MVLITPTCVPKNTDDLQDMLDEVVVFSRHIHVDIDDGVFTSVLSWPYETVGVLGKVGFEKPEGLSVGVHLMVRDVEETGTVFARAGAGTIVGHIEAFADIERAPQALDAWRAAGADEVGLAILLDTDVALLEVAINSCDLIHILSVQHIGEQGAPFDIRALERVKKIRELYPHITISVDGGINEKNIIELARAGANRFAVGSAIMRSPNPSEAYMHLKELAESAIQ